MTTIYDRIGGSEAVLQMLDEFYARVLGDPDLRPFFSTTPLDRLKVMQAEFFAAALDGPVVHSDRDLSAIHKGMGITRSDVTKFVNHLIATLKERESIETGDAMDIVFRIATFTDQVIDDPGGEDG